MPGTVISVREALVGGAGVVVGNDKLFYNLRDNIAQYHPQLQRYTLSDDKLSSGGDGCCVKVNFTTGDWTQHIGRFSEYSIFSAGGDYALTAVEYMLVCVFDACKRKDADNMRAAKDWLCVLLRTDDHITAVVALWAQPENAIRAKWFLQLAIWCGGDVYQVVINHLVNRDVLGNQHTLLIEPAGSGPATGKSILQVLSEDMGMKTLSAAIQATFAAVDRCLSTGKVSKPQRRSVKYEALSQKNSQEGLWVVTALRKLTDEPAAKKLYDWWAQQVANNGAIPDNIQALLAEVHGHERRSFIHEGEAVKVASGPNTPVAGVGRPRVSFAPINEGGSAGQGQNPADERTYLLPSDDDTGASAGCCCIL